MNTSIMTQNEYEQAELLRFNKGSGPYFETFGDFIDDIAEQPEGHLSAQLVWIENGDFGAGATVALRQAYLDGNHKQVAIILLMALGGYSRVMATSHESRLPYKTVGMDKAIANWFTWREHQFAV